MINYIKDRLWLWAVKHYKSRLGFANRPHFKYYEKSKKSFKKEEEYHRTIVEAADHFNEYGWATITTPETKEIAASVLKELKSEEATGESPWSNEDGRYKNGDFWKKFPQLENLFLNTAGKFFKSVYQCEYKILFGVSYKSVNRNEHPVGSQLWHFDGSPGTCINLMYCLGPVGPENGAMECISWPDFLQYMKWNAKAFSKYEKIGKRKTSYGLKELILRR